MECSLVTGASGFIGSHLCRFLEQSGQKVTYLPRELLYKPTALKRFIQLCAPDYIYHLAAYGNKYDQQDENNIVLANIIAGFNLLKSCQQIPYKAFINVSSSSTLLPYETFYSATKASTERLCNAFVNKYNKPIVSVRPFSVYGPGDDESKFIPTAIKAFKENQELKVTLGMHDWIYIDDFISGVLIVAQNVQKLKGKAVDIGTGIETSNMGVVCILQDIFQKHGFITKVGKMRDYDGNHWQADQTLLESLGWKPQLDLEDGLRKIIYG